MLPHPKNRVALALKKTQTIGRVLSQFKARVKRKKNKKSHSLPTLESSQRKNLHQKNLVNLVRVKVGQTLGNPLKILIPTVLRKVEVLNLKYHTVARVHLRVIQVKMIMKIHRIAMVLAAVVAVVAVEANIQGNLTS
jgi:hypothetical protein